MDYSDRFPAFLESLAEAHDYNSYLEKLEVARTVRENVTLTM
jgi:hypothetical protein